MKNEQEPPPYYMPQPQPIGFEQPAAFASTAPPPPSYNSSVHPPSSAPPYPLDAGFVPPPLNAGSHPPLNAGSHPPLNAGSHPPLNAGSHPPLNAGSHPPLNATHQQISTTYVYPSGISQPLTQQTNVSALNVTPRSYSRWTGSARDRKIGVMIFVVVSLVMLIIFLILFFTTFSRANSDFEEAQKRHEEFRNKHFSNW